MAIQFLSELNTNKNQIQQSVLHKSATAPTSPVAGQVYYNTTDNNMYYYNGTTWINMDTTDITHLSTQATSLTCTLPDNL